MGGLRRKMPVTFWTFVIGTLALAGLPPFSGFYSKDEVLATALQVAPWLFFVGVGVAILTTFYMGRLVLVTFLGEARSDAASHAHESPRAMTWPLLVLAVPSIGLAWFPLGEHIASAFGGHGHGGAHGAPGGSEVGLMPLLGRVFGGMDSAVLGPFNHNTMAATFGLFAALLGGSLAWACYGRAGVDPVPGKLGAWARFMRNRFYLDEVYSGLVIPAHDVVAMLFSWADRWLINGLALRGLHGTFELAGRTLRLVQSGNLQTYSFLFAAGLAIVAWFFLR